MFVITMERQIFNALVFGNVFSGKYVSSLRVRRSTSKMLTKDSSALSFRVCRKLKTVATKKMQTFTIL